MEQPLLQIGRREPLHGEVRLRAVPNRGVNLDEMGMFQLLTELMLPPQQLDLLTVLNVVIQKGFNPHDPLIGVIIGLPNQAGVPGVDDIQESIRTDIAGNAFCHGAHALRGCVFPIPIQCNSDLQNRQPSHFRTLPPSPALHLGGDAASCSSPSVRPGACLADTSRPGRGP